MGESTPGSDLVRSQGLARVASGSGMDSGGRKLHQDSTSLLIAEKGRSRDSSLSSVRSGASALSTGSNVSAFSNCTESDLDYSSKYWEMLVRSREEEDGIMTVIEKTLQKMEEACRTQPNVNKTTKDGIVLLNEKLSELKSARDETKRSEESYQKSVTGLVNGFKWRTKTRRIICTQMINSAVHTAEKNLQKKRKKRTPPSSPEEAKVSKRQAKDETQVATLPNAKRKKKKANKKPKKAETEKKKNQNSKKKVQRIDSTQPKILVRIPSGKSYADVLGKIRKDARPEESGATVTGTAPTGKGDLLLQLKKGSNRQAFAASLKDAVNEIGAIVENERLESVEIRDLDSLTEKKEVQQVVAHALGLSTPPEVTLLGPNQRGQKVAILSMGETQARKLIQLGFIRVGITSCRIRRRVQVIRCYRCLGFGHLRKECKGEDRTQACYKCGSTDHKKIDCTNHAACFLCPQQDQAHQAGSRECASFKRALNKAREKPKTTKRGYG